MKFIDKVKKNKLLYFLGVLIIGVFIILIVRFTYAYLALNVNEARENVTLSSDETDNLDFVLGDPLSIDATPTTLPENGENLTDTTTATAVLLANSTNETANYSYWVYFTISSNTFIYSDGSTPEIILTVTDPEGNPVTNIDGLTYGTYNGVAGFDVTTKYGMFTVASDYAITANSSTTATEQTWTFTLTYLNQNYDQSINYGNSMTTEISMTKEKVYPTLANYIISNVYTGVDGENGIYYHDGVGNYTNADQEAGDNSYRFSGDYVVAQAYQDVYINILDVIDRYYKYNNTAYSSEDLDTVLAREYCDINNCNYEDVINSNELDDYKDTLIENGTIRNYFTVDYNNTYEYERYYDAVNQAIKDGYLEVVVNNYVCFGSDATPCPTDNLYRIIGVFNDDNGNYQVKLIKYDYATSEMLGQDGDYVGTFDFGDYYNTLYKGNLDTDQVAIYSWNRANLSTAYNETGYYNVWSYSVLNTVNLNTNYLNYLGENWSNMIAEHSWTVGGYSYSDLDTTPSGETAKNVYVSEIENPNTDVETEYTAKIGLMYVSDYGYATSPDYWTELLFNYGYDLPRLTSWLYMGANEWTITRYVDESREYIHVKYPVVGGALTVNAVQSQVAVRPVFYLKSDVIVTAGTGTQTDPYRITLDTTNE